MVSIEHGNKCLTCLLAESSNERNTILLKLTTQAKWLNIELNFANINYKLNSEY